MKLKSILSECWTGYKQVGLKNKGGKQVPNCVPESVTESSKDDIIKDLDKAKSDLLKKVDVLIAKKKKLYSNVDIESPMSSGEKKLDKDIADLFSELNKLVLQKRSLKESIDEGKLPGMYVKFLAVSKKVRELEDAQKELAKKYFDEKDLNKKEAFLKQLKKGTEELKSRRRNLQDIEQTYITGLDKDVELSMED